MLEPVDKDGRRSALHLPARGSSHEIGGLLDKVIGIILLAIGVVFIAFAAVGLFNSTLGAREVLLIITLVSGLVVFPVGLWTLRGASASQRSGPGG